MAEETQIQESKEDKRFRIGMIIFAILLSVIVLVACTISILSDSDLNKASISDIDGYWNSTVSEQSYVFIPKYNINGLEFTFSIRDKNNKELQTIVKTVGDVKKGQQYTVSISMTELKDFTTLMDTNYTQLTVTGGTKKLI